MTIAGIRDAIKTALETITGLRAYDTVPDTVNELPVAWVIPRSGSYDYTVGNNMVMQFEVTVLVSRQGSISEAQDKLDGYILPTGSGSVKAVVDAAILSTHAQAIRVTDFREYGGLEFGGAIYAGVKFGVEVIV